MDRTVPGAEARERGGFVDIAELHRKRRRERIEPCGGIGGERGEAWHEPVVAACDDGPMPKTRIDEAQGLTVADVTHAKFTALPATATVGDVRAWFAASTSRRQAFVADGDRYLGALTPADVDGDVDPARPAVELAQEGPTVAPDAPATTGRDLALLTETRRVPVVDGDGRLLGVVAVTGDLQSFCGTESPSRRAS